MFELWVGNCRAAQEVFLPPSLHSFHSDPDSALHMCNMENGTLDTQGYVRGGEEVETQGPHRRQPTTEVYRTPVM